MQDNQISVNFSKEELNKINEATKILQEILLPKLVKLNNEQRQEIVKMGDKTLAFVTKSYEHAKQNPTLVPAYLDINEMKIDLDAVETLRQIFNPLQEITQDLEDSMTLSGSEAFIASLAFYNAIKGASKSKIGASEQIYNDLSQRFARPSRKKDNK